MNFRIMAFSITALAVCSACGGGAGGYGTTTTPPVGLQTVAPSAPVTAGLTTASFTTATRGAQMGFDTSNGFAAYDFDLDLTTPNSSSCVATCATFWPPIIVPAGSAFVLPFGTIRRPDATLQLAYNGHPLYNYSQDTNVTAATGDGLNVSGGLWHLAQAAALTTPLGTPTSTP